MRFGLLGWPVQHSLSPPMQQAAFHACGLDASYELIETRPEEVCETVKRLQSEGFCGWNATVPHKAAMAALVTQAEAVARAADSVNTVVVQNGHLDGYSTDGYGLEEALREAFGLVLPGSAIAFIGAGGAARACSMYFAERGIRRLVVANRRLERAEKLLQDVRQFKSQVEGCTCALSDSDTLCQELENVDVVIQATPLGLHEHDPSPLPGDCLPRGIPAMDMIYRRTPFLRHAACRGAPTADGRGMLLHQGARSFQLWTGTDAPVDEMRQALETALAQR